jgi:phage FluMu protein Com
MPTSFSTHCPHCKIIGEFQSSTTNGIYSFTCPLCHKIFYVQFKDSKPVATKK